MKWIAIIIAICSVAAVVIVILAVVKVIHRKRSVLVPTVILHHKQLRGSLSDTIHNCRAPILNLVVLEF